LFDTPITPFYSAPESDFSFLNSAPVSDRAGAARSGLGDSGDGDLPGATQPTLAHSGTEVALLHTGFGCMTKGSFGELLKRERELREVTLNEVTVATRIPPRFLEAFEREDWETLPGGVFNRGFVRAIARYLGLDEENLLSEYDLAYGEQRPAMPELAEDPIPSPPKWAVAVGGIAILLLLLAAVWGSVYGWRLYEAHRAAKRAALTASADATVPPAQTPSPVTAPPAGPNAALAPQPLSAHAANPAANTSSANPSGAPGDANSAAPQRLDLAVSTSGQTRVRVVADGRIVLDGRLPAGEKRRLFAKNQFVVSAAHPDVVLLELNGQAMPPLTSAGASGTMVLSQKDLRQAPSGNAQR
jgi:cytoskeleton protein RodZ